MANPTHKRNETTALDGDIAQGLDFIPLVIFTKPVLAKLKTDFVKVRKWVEISF